MIQRIQTVYLFLAAVIAGLYLYTPVLLFEYSTGSQAIRAYELKFFYEGYFIFVVLIAGIMSSVASLIAVLLFKKPGLQKSFSVLSMVGMLFCIVYVYYKWQFVDYKDDAIFYYGNITPWVVIILNILAIVGINKDQALLKSYDRLR